jgi:hypothetical protein
MNVETAIKAGVAISLALTSLFGYFVLIKPF